MKSIIKKHIVLIIFLAAGAVAGFLYWKYVGCTSGTCFIKSKWYMSTLYGILLGYVTGGLAEDAIMKFKKSPGHER
jgi:hypothetical protein